MLRWSSTALGQRQVCLCPDPDTEDTAGLVGDTQGTAMAGTATTEGHRPCMHRGQCRGGRFLDVRGFYN